MGIAPGNSWLEIYKPRVNFVGSNDWVHHTYSFINRHPQASELLEFSVSATDLKRRVMRGTLI
ncbi:hypothetical protein [Edaphobacter modestus]|uniref:hypothetical protein n=1 Tax=Edaphobacter modestus TaxID=388466 RepID=UPI00102CD1E0|nr:hypothetical protein [Edaphobacter modestus]